MEFLSIAVDAQGPDLPTRYTTKASTTFTTVVDAENRLGQALGCKAIPNAVFVDEQGTVRYIKRGGFDIHKPEHLALAESWAASPSLDELSTLSEAEAEKVIKHPEALEHFRRGLALYHDGKTDEAMAAGRECALRRADAGGYRLGRKGRHRDRRRVPVLRDAGGWRQDRGAEPRRRQARRPPHDHGPERRQHLLLRDRWVRERGGARRGAGGHEVALVAAGLPAGV